MDVACFDDDSRSGHIIDDGDDDYNDDDDRPNRARSCLSSFARARINEAPV